MGGHCERNMYRAGGSSVSLLQPLLDNQGGLKNMEGVERQTMTLDRAMNIIHDVFISAAERNLQTSFNPKLSRTSRFPSLIRQAKLTSITSLFQREIHTGDGICFNIINKDGVKEETIPLR